MPTDTALQVLTLAPRLNRWAETRVGRAENETGLSLRQLSALAMIEDETTTLGDVARQLMVTPAVVTGLIDRLERRGYARRINSTGDRRRVHLALTAEGRNAADTVNRQLIDELSARLETLPEKDRQLIDQACQKLGDILRDLEAKPSANGSSNGHNR